MILLYVLLISAATIIDDASAGFADCTGLPTNEELEHLLSVVLGHAEEITIQGNPVYPCRVPGSTVGTYRELSAIVAYKSSNDSFSTLRVRQFEMVCIAIGSLLFPGTPSVLDSSFNYTNVAVEEHCIKCSALAGNDSHCVLGQYDSCNSLHDIFKQCNFFFPP